MRKLLLIGLLLNASFAFSQAWDQNINYIKDSKTYGYVNGVRLDSIDMEYVNVGDPGGTSIFDYGQGGRVKSMLITDKKGLVFSFPRNNYVLKLNFLYYNGWELVPDTSINLFRKRR